MAVCIGRRGAAFWDGKPYFSSAKSQCISFNGVSYKRTPELITLIGRDAGGKLEVDSKTKLLKLINMQFFLNRRLLWGIGYDELTKPPAECGPAWECRVRRNMRQSTGAHRPLLRKLELLAGSCAAC